MLLLSTDQALLFGGTIAPHATIGTCRFTQTAAPISAVLPDLQQIQAHTVQSTHWLCWICCWLKRHQLLRTLTTVSACNQRQLSSARLPLRLPPLHQSWTHHRRYHHRQQARPRRRQQAYLRRRCHALLHRHQQAHPHRRQRASGRRPGSLWRQGKLPKHSGQGMHSRQRQTLQLHMPVRRAQACHHCASGVNSSRQMITATMTSSSSSSCATTQVSVLSIAAALASNHRSHAYPYPPPPPPLPPPHQHRWKKQTIGTSSIA